MRAPPHDSCLISSPLPYQLGLALRGLERTSAYDTLPRSEMARAALSTRRLPTVSNSSSPRKNAGNNLRASGGHVHTSAPESKASRWGKWAFRSALNTVATVIVGYPERSVGADRQMHAVR